MGFTAEQVRQMQDRVAGKATEAKKSKYKAVQTVVDGIKFSSKKEAKRWGELRLLEQAGVIKQLERQVTYNLVVNGLKICAYRCDYRYFRWAEKDWVVEDVKGMRHGAAYDMFKLKKKLMKALLNIDVVEI